MQYTTQQTPACETNTLFYQDFKDTFVCNTQLTAWADKREGSCSIRISKILLYAIHNLVAASNTTSSVVLSGFQRYFCMQYTTIEASRLQGSWLFYQDFKDTFICNTQLGGKVYLFDYNCFIRISMNNLKDIHNTSLDVSKNTALFYQDFNESLRDI